jgi:formylglycine-generating enzyme required for sulfatase activity
MDATEVTNAQYAQFLTATGPDLDGTTGHLVDDPDPGCWWKVTYIPNRDSTKDAPGPNTPWPVTGKDAYPVANVDWCDAYAYCKWAGKHLCGKIGGGTNSYADYADATKSEWFNACSKGGTQTYPYGNTYSGTACPGGEPSGLGPELPCGGSSQRPGCYSWTVTVPVGSTATCKGGYAGLFDLSGNLGEWEDSCSHSAVGPWGDACRPRGGGDNDTDPDLACGFDYQYGDVVRGSRYSNLGFRCCGTSL